MLVVKHYRKLRRGSSFSRWTCFKWSVVYVCHWYKCEYQWWRNMRWAKKHPKEARERLKPLMEFLEAAKKTAKAEKGSE